MNWQSNRIFLIDGIGALLTAFLLGFVLARFEEYVGMPPSILYLLSAIAFTYAIYSLTCRLKIKGNWKPYLKIIAFANLAYCVITLSLVIFYYSNLTALGLGYFVLEIVIIVVLAKIELTIVSNQLIN